MYKLTIDTSHGSVTVESDSFSYLKDVQEALHVVHEKADLTEKNAIHSLIDGLFDAEIKKQPAKKRGRPVGSTNKVRKAK
jgi:hypothetical protein